MLRLLFWILLAGNLLFFVVMYGGSYLFATTSQAPVGAELNPQKISLQGQVLSAPVVAPLSSVSMAPALASAVSVVAAASPVASAVVSAVASVVPAVSAVAPKRASLACMEWAGFSSQEVRKAKQALENLKLEIPVVQREVKHDSVYWVYIPPPKKLAKVAQKINELKAAHVTKYEILEEEGPRNGTFSFGTFSTLKEAKAAAVALKKVSGVRVGQYRPAYQTALLALDGLDGATLAQLTQLQKRFPASSLNSVACH